VRSVGSAFSGSEQGPQVDVDSVEKIARLCKAGVDEGARRARSVELRHGREHGVGVRAGGAAVVAAGVEAHHVEPRAHEQGVEARVQVAWRRGAGGGAGLASEDGGAAGDGGCEASRSWAMQCSRVASR
jgi:hypothetical protein